MTLKRTIQRRIVVSLLVIAVFGVVRLVAQM
jgi:hypothetical protein